MSLGNMDEYSGPQAPGETRSEYLERLAMEEQMAADFATIELPTDGGPFRRARVLVEAHIADYGRVAHPDKLKHSIGVEMGLAEIRGIDRIRADRDSWKSQFESAEAAAQARIAELEARIAELEAHIARSTELFDYLSRPDRDKPQVSSLHLWLQCMEAVAAGRSLLAARAGIGASHEG